MTTKKSGGAREGAGRPKKVGPPKKQIPAKVDIECLEHLKALSEKSKKSQAKITQFAILNTTLEDIQKI